MFPYQIAAFKHYFKFCIYPNIKTKGCEVYTMLKTVLYQVTVCGEVAEVSDSHAEGPRFESRCRKLFKFFFLIRDNYYYL